RALDAAALAALAVLIWDASARGGVNAGNLSGGGVDPVIVLLPALVALAGAVAAARVLPAVLRGLERLAHRAPVDVRLGLAAAGGTQLDLLGYPARSLRTLRGWRSDFTDVPIASLAPRLGSRAAVNLTLAGERIPSGLPAIGFVAAVAGTPVALVLELQRADGSFEAIPLAGRLRPGSHVV